MKLMPAELLTRGAAILGIQLTAKQVDLYLKYLVLLGEWNKKINLTAIKAPEEVVVKHFLDSLSLIPYVQWKRKMQILDVGAGAGFPGVPIKVARPETEIVLLDSLKKRIEFLNKLICELELSGISAVHGRAEDFGRRPDFREAFDLVVSRAVARLSVLVELCLPFVQVGGLFAAYKSTKAAVEINEARVAVTELGGKLSQQVEINLPGTAEKRTIVIIKKEKPTPEKYPRKAGVPEKRPLG